MVIEAEFLKVLFSLEPVTKIKQWDCVWTTRNSYPSLFAQQLKITMSENLGLIKIHEKTSSVSHQYIMAEKRKGKKQFPLNFVLLSEHIWGDFLFWALYFKRDND